MQENKWTDEKLTDTLEKSGRLPFVLSRKSRSKIQRALLEENARLGRQEQLQKRRRLSSVLASLSNR
jgi:hypothetical protein